MAQVHVVDSDDDDDDELLQVLGRAEQKMVVDGVCSQCQYKGEMGNGVCEFCHQGPKEVKVTTQGFGGKRTQVGQRAMGPEHADRRFGGVNEPRQVEHDPDTINTWLYPQSDDYPMRAYQKTIVESCLLKNTLVCLPTGLGKTFIAAVVMYNYLRWFPTGKIIFMAPTKPLVSQQVEACHKIVGIPEKLTAHLNGQINPLKREKYWKEARLFYCTPQTVAKDCSAGRMNIRDVVLVVIDEAHRATGNYAVCVVMQELAQVKKNFRVLALSATPGSNRQKVQEVIQNTMITHIEYKSEDDPDVKPYVFNKMMEIVKVKSSNRSKDVVCELEWFANDQLQKMSQYSFLPTLFRKKAKDLTKDAVINFQGQLLTRFNNVPKTTLYTINGRLALLTSLLHGRKLLLEHGPTSMHAHLQGLMTKKSQYGLSVSKKVLFSSDRWVTFMKSVREMKGNPENSPKLGKLIEILREHFSRMKAGNKQTSCIVFAQFRHSVAEIHDAILEYTGLRVKPFVGQSSRSKKKKKKKGESKSSDSAEEEGQEEEEGEESVATKGQKQAEQQQIVQDFKKGLIDVIVATCIGEEGLDIGSVDLIVSYDALSSPIRMIQRFGRTGRKRSGKVVILVSEGKESDNLTNGNAKSKMVGRLLRNRQHTLTFYPQNPPVRPPDCPRPRLVFERFEINAYHASQVVGIRKTPKQKKTKTKRVVEKQSKRTKRSKTRIVKKIVKKNSPLALTEAEKLYYDTHIATKNRVPAIRIPPLPQHFEVCNISKSSRTIACENILAFIESQQRQSTVENEIDGLFEDSQLFALTPSEPPQEVNLISDDEDNEVVVTNATSNIKRNQTLVVVEKSNGNLQKGDVVERKEVDENEQSVEIDDCIENKEIVQNDETILNENVVESVVNDETIGAVENVITVKNKSALGNEETVETAGVLETSTTAGDKQLVKNDGTVENTAVVENATTAGNRKAVESEVTVENTGLVENATTAGKRKVVESEEASENASTVGNKKVIESEQTVENSTIAGNKKVVENEQTVENATIVASKQATESEEAVENAGIVENITTAGNKKLAESEETVENVEAAENDATHCPKRTVVENEPKIFVKGNTVTVESRTGPGMNKQGGSGIVTKVNEDGTYDVRYTVNRGLERNIPVKFIQAGICVENEQVSGRSKRRRVRPDRKNYVAEFDSQTMLLTESSTPEAIQVAKSNSCEETLESWLEEIDDDCESYFEEEIPVPPNLTVCAASPISRSRCSVCGLGGSLVTCSRNGCGVTVHAKCFGCVDAEWICDCCRAGMGRLANRRCMLCPRHDGAMKQVDRTTWVHIACCAWNNNILQTYDKSGALEELGLERAVKSGILELGANRCVFCKHEIGVCITCSYPNCMVTFHASCAIARSISRPFCSGHFSLVSSNESPRQQLTLATPVSLVKSNLVAENIDELITPRATSSKRCHDDIDGSSHHTKLTKRSPPVLSAPFAESINVNKGKREGMPNELSCSFENDNGATSRVVQTSNADMQNPVENKEKEHHDEGDFISPLMQTKSKRSTKDDSDSSSLQARREISGKRVQDDFVSPIAQEGTKSNQNSRQDGIHKDTKSNEKAKVNIPPVPQNKSKCIDENGGEPPTSNIETILNERCEEEDEFISPIIQRHAKSKRIVRDDDESPFVCKSSVKLMENELISPIIQRTRNSKRIIEDDEFESPVVCAPAPVELKEPAEDDEFISPILQKGAKSKRIIDDDDESPFVQKHTVKNDCSFKKVGPVSRVVDSRNSRRVHEDEDEVEFVSPIARTRKRIVDEQENDEFDSPVVEKKKILKKKKKKAKKGQESSYFGKKKTLDLIEDEAEVSGSDSDANSDCDQDLDGTLEGLIDDSSQVSENSDMMNVYRRSLMESPVFQGRCQPIAEKYIEIVKSVVCIWVNGKCSKSLVLQIGRSLRGHSGVYVEVQNKFTLGGAHMVLSARACVVVLSQRHLLKLMSGKGMGENSSLLEDHISGLALYYSVIYVVVQYDSTEGIDLQLYSNDTFSEDFFLAYMYLQDTMNVVPFLTSSVAESVETIVDLARAEEDVGLISLKVTGMFENECERYREILEFLVRIRGMNLVVAKRLLYLNRGSCLADIISGIKPRTLVEAVPGLAMRICGLIATYINRVWYAGRFAQGR